MSYRTKYHELIDKLIEGIVKHYRNRLVSVAIFGSIAKDTFRPDSDIDILLVVVPLANGRIKRVREFEARVEDRLTGEFKKLSAEGIHPVLSPIIKTPEEVSQGSPLFLDMTESVKIYYDKDEFLQRYLLSLTARLKRLGARKVFYKGGYYWILKPDYQPGEIIEL